MCSLACRIVNRVVKSENIVSSQASSHLATLSFKLVLILLTLTLFTSNISYAQQRASSDTTRLSLKGLRIGGPVFIPPLLAPSETPRQVVVGATLAGIENMPSMVYLEEITSEGVFIDVIGELRDDGKLGDYQARDGRYINRNIELGNPSETERFFRIRVRQEGGVDAGVSEVETSILTTPVMVPFTDLSFGYPPPDDIEKVVVMSGETRAYANEVLFTSIRNYSPRLVKELISYISDEFGAPVKIIGYIPSISAYMLRFEGEKTFQEIDRLITLLKNRSEVREVTPNYMGENSAEWWLEQTGAERLRVSAENVVDSDPLPATGGSQIGVAVIEIGLTGGVDCTALSCVTQANWLTATETGIETETGTKACDGYYGVETPHNHGIKVGNLLADSEIGIAPGITKVLPLRATGADIPMALECLRLHNMNSAASAANIVNLSFSLISAAGLADAMCYVACDNVLMVAAAGNTNCPPNVAAPLPGSYGTEATACSCGSSVDLTEFVLQVGASDDNKNRGDSCNTNENIASHEGEIYAPGWGVPPAPLNGTSWAAPLVSGCAAIRGEIELWRGNSWDAKEVEYQLMDTADEPELPSEVILLNCYAAALNSYDIVFLLDRSGSMDTSVGATGTRWDALRRATNDIAMILSETAPSGSRVGLTLFSSAVTEPMGLGLEDIVPATPNTSSTAATIDGHLDLTPGGSTGMGAGLINATAKLSQSSSNRPRVVVLFTDGEQNHPLPEVDSEGCFYVGGSNNGNPIADGCPNGMFRGSRKIIPVGVTTPNSTYLQTLQALADKHRGTFILTTNGTDIASTGSSPLPCVDIEEIFDCVVAPALYGSSLQMLAVSRSSLLPDIALHEFDVNKYVEKVLIKLTVPQHSHFNLSDYIDQLQIEKDGIDVTPYFKKTSGTSGTTLLFSTDFLAKDTKTYPGRIDASGYYVVRLKSDINTWAHLQRLQQPLRVVSFADDHRLDMLWELASATPQVGQVLTPRVQLRWAGRALRNADVVAIIAIPGDDLGDALARNSLIVDPITGVDASSPGRQKYEQLLRNNQNFRDQLAPAYKHLQLKHKTDGWYEADIELGDISGVYNIVYQVMIKGADFGVVQRTASQSTYVRFGKIDLKKSIISSATRNHRIVITMKPVSTTGKLIGPGQGSLFSISGLAEKDLNVIDHQDGSYTFTYIADPDTFIEFLILGEVIYSGAANFSDV